MRLPRALSHATPPARFLAGVPCESPPADHRHQPRPAELTQATASDQTQLSRATLTLLCAVPRHDASRAPHRNRTPPHQHTIGLLSRDRIRGDAAGDAARVSFRGRRSRARNPGDLSGSYPPSGFRPALRATGMTEVRASRCSCASPSLQGRATPRARPEGWPERSGGRVGCSPQGEL